MTAPPVASAIFDKIAGRGVLFLARYWPTASGVTLIWRAKAALVISLILRKSSRFINRIQTQRLHTVNNKNKQTVCISFYGRDYNLRMQHRLKEIRKELNLTQTDLAEMCDMSLQMLQYLENGQRQITAKWLEKFSEVLKIPVWYLLVDPKTILDEDDRILASRFAALTDEGRSNILKAFELEEFKQRQ